MPIFGKCSVISAAQSIAIGDFLFSIASLLVHFTESFAVNNPMGDSTPTKPWIFGIHHSPEYVLYAKYVLCWIYMGVNVANILLAILLWQAVLHENILKTIGYLVIYPALILTGISAFLYHILVLGPSPYYYGVSMYPSYYLWKIASLFIVKRFLEEIRSSPGERRRRGDYAALGGSRETLMSSYTSSGASTSIGTGAFMDDSFMNRESQGGQYEMIQIQIQLPKSYEIPEERLKLDHQTCLDTGELHAVIRGVLELLAPAPAKGAQSQGSRKTKAKGQEAQGEFSEVAVKTLKVTTPTIPHSTRLLQEAKMMVGVGEHENILRIFGVCVKSSLKDKLFLVTEYYPKGTVDKFLQDCVTTYEAKNFRNLIDSEGRIEASETRVYENVPISKIAFDTHNLLEWACQIASAVEHLHTKRVVHGCLQGKTVVMMSTTLVKLSDFSFAAKLKSQGRVVKREDLPMRFPFRWSALECVMSDTLQFSTRTDVWSYGVFLYELFSLGEIPYGAWDSDIVRNLWNGMRLGQPKYANPQIYQIMLACWRKDPIDRPNFSLLKLFFQQLLTSLKKAGN